MTVVTLLLARDVVIDRTNRAHVVKAFRALTGLWLLEAATAVDTAGAIGYSTTATDRRHGLGATVGVHELKYNDAVYGHVSIIERS